MFDIKAVIAVLVADIGDKVPLLPLASFMVKSSLAFWGRVAPKSNQAVAPGSFISR